MVLVCGWVLLVFGAGGDFVLGVGWWCLWGVCGLGWVGFVNGWVIGVICLYVVVVVSCIYLLGFRGVWYGVWDNVWLCVDWLVSYRYL